MPPRKPGTTSPSNENKLPPHNVEAEESLLGSCLIAGDEVMPEAIQILTPKAFWEERNRFVFQAMVDLFDAERPIDQISVSTELQGRNKLQAIGGVAYLSHIVANLPSSVHATHWAHMVQSCYVRRELIDIAGKIAGTAYTPSAPDAKEVIEEASQIFDQVWAILGETPFIITDLVKQQSDAPIYSMKVNNLPIRISLDDFLDFKRFRKHVMGACNFVPAKHTDAEWVLRLNRMLKTVKVEVAPPEASGNYEIWQAAVSLIKDQPYVETVEEFEAGKPRQSGNRVYVKASPFIKSWKQKLKQTGRQVDVNLLWAIFKEHGAQDGTTRLGQKTVYGWHLPLSALEDNYRPPAPPEEVWELL